MKTHLSVRYLISGIILLTTLARQHEDVLHAESSQVRRTTVAGKPKSHIMDWTPTAEEADTTVATWLLSEYLKSQKEPPKPAPRKKIVSVVESNHDVIYVYDNHDCIRRSGGTRAWRNNNPGNLRYSEFARKMGTIGHAGGFAVFPDMQTGMAAIAGLLQSNKYSHYTISEAIYAYAPPVENDTAGYEEKIHHMTGLPGAIKLCDLSPAQLQNVVHAIKIIEGWHAGTENLSVAQIPPRYLTLPEPMENADSMLYARLNPNNFWLRDKSQKTI